MNRQIFKLEPIFLEKIWGGNNLQQMYACDQGVDNLGEVWLFSAIKEGDSLVNIADKQVPLSEFFITYYEQLGVKQGEQPTIQLRLVDCVDDLSLQLHPDDKIAQNEGQLNGKDETWIILKSGPDAKLIMGCDSNQAKNFKLGGSVDNLFASAYSYSTNYQDVFHIESGLLHALGANNFVLEISQPSNTTYRVFDYNRLDSNNKPRELHIEQSRAALKPNLTATKLETITNFSEGKQVKTTSIPNRYNFEIVQISEATTITTNEKYQVIFVVQADELTFNGEEVNAGESFVVYADTEIKTTGKGRMVIAYE